MSDLLKGDGRTHINSGLMRESLVSKKLIKETDAITVKSMVPDVNMLCVGGRSIMDRGAEAILPFVDAVAALNGKYKMVLGVGGGARARHTFSIGIDLGLPIGGLARIVGGVEENNRDILQFLLAPHGGITFVKDHFQDLQLFLNNGMIPVCIGQPPYHFWEPPSVEKGKLPDNGPDTGLFLMAEVMGAKKVIYIKDVDGVFTNDPQTDKNAKHIPSIRAQELLDMNLPDLPVERELLRSLETARTVKAVHVINGLDPRNLEKALAGETVGTIIYNGKHELAGSH